MKKATSGKFLDLTKYLNKIDEEVNITEERSCREKEEMETTIKCEACGQRIEEVIKDEKHANFCSECTLDGTIEPIFESIVYRTILRTEKGGKAQDEETILNKTRQEIEKLPYWKDKKQPDTITVQDLKTAGNLLNLTSKMSKLQVDEEIFEPKDFFISHKHHEHCDQELVDPLIQELKERGYKIWYDKDTWGNAVGEEIEWEKRGIEQARHGICILCQDFFKSKACTFELKHMLQTKEKNYIHSIWWTDITEEFLKKDELGKQVLAIKKEKDAEKSDIQAERKLSSRKKEITTEKISELVEHLIEQANRAEGPIKYNGVELRADEARMMGELEKLLNEKIPVIEKKEKEQALFGFWAEKGHITHLHLQEKKLNRLPASFAQLQGLKSLKIQGNRFQAVPRSFNRVLKHPVQQYSKNYSEIKAEEAEVLGLLEMLVGKQIPQVSEITTSTFFIAEGKEVTGLGLFQALTSLPASIGDLVNLQTLNLTWNNLSSLPASIGNLKNLQTLDLGMNQLSSLPASIGNLKNLQKLFLYNNQLSSLPETFGNLTNLQTLFLMENQLTSLPENFGQLTNLKELFLSSNQLTSLPASLLQLPKFKQLVVDSELQNDPVVKQLQAKDVEVGFHDRILL